MAFFNLTFLGNQNPFKAAAKTSPSAVTAGLEQDLPTTSTAATTLDRKEIEPGQPFSIPKTEPSLQFEDRLQEESQQSSDSERTHDGPPDDQHSPHDQYIPAHSDMLYSSTPQTIHTHKGSFTKYSAMRTKHQRNSEGIIYNYGEFITYRAY